MVAMKLCSTPGCDNPAAYRTRSKPVRTVWIASIALWTNLVWCVLSHLPVRVTGCSLAARSVELRRIIDSSTPSISTRLASQYAVPATGGNGFATAGRHTESVREQVERFRNEYCSKLSPLVAISYSMLYPATGQGRSCTMYVASHAAGLASSDWAILYGVAPAPRPRVSSVRLVGKSWISMRVRGGRDNLWQKSQGNN